MNGCAELGTPRIGMQRAYRVERLLAVCATERSARALTHAADAALAICSRTPDAGTVGELAETLFLKVAVQDLLVAQATGAVDLADRLGALAVGLVDGASRLIEIRVSAPRVMVTGRVARWLTALSTEILDSFSADMPGKDVRATLRVVFRNDVVLMTAEGNADEATSPSLHLDRVRAITVAIGGRVRETLGLGSRTIEVTVPCRRISAAS